MFMGLHLLSAVAAQVQGAVNEGTGRHFAGLRGAAADTEQHGVVGPAHRGVFRVTVSLVRLNNDVVGTIKMYPNRLDIVAFGANDNATILRRRVVRTMERAYGLSMAQMSVQILVAPARPNQLDNLLSVLFTLREAMDVSAPRTTRGSCAG